MDKRSYKHTGEEVSLLGFGCMRFPLSGETPRDIDVAKAQEMLDYAMANGVNYYDTAYPYHGGRSESFVGEALVTRYPRERFYLASKMPPWSAKTEEDVARIFEEQLQKCKTEYFDYYLVHNLTPENVAVMKNTRMYEYLREMQQKGAIRRLGFSFHARPELLEELVRDYSWDFAQIQLNYLDWELQEAERQYTILTEAEIPVIVMEPVRGGSLVSLCEESVEIFKSANPQASTASWAIRYAASLPNVLTVLSGMSTMEQVQDNIDTLSGFQPLQQADYDTIDKALEAYRRAATIPCTDCRYCMPCPAGVDIPKVFTIYNQNQIKQNRVSFLSSMGILGENKQAKNCVSCGKCMEHCPQNIEIATWMETIAESVRG